MRKRYCKGHGCASSFTRRIHPCWSLILHNHTDGFIHSLAEPIFWIAAAICVVAELMILRAAFAPPKHAGVTAEVPQSPRGTEMIWAVIPAIVLALLLAATWQAVH